MLCLGIFKIFQVEKIINILIPIQKAVFFWYGTCSLQRNVIYSQQNLNKMKFNPLRDKTRGSRFSFVVIFLRVNYTFRYLPKPSLKVVKEDGSEASSSSSITSEALLSSVV